MSNGLGFNNYASTYMAQVVSVGGTTPGLLVQQAIENLAVGLQLQVNSRPIGGAYPFYGGTADSHALNLFGSQYPIVWEGTITHNSNGVTGNGTTGLGRIQMNPASALNPVDWNMGVYCRTNTATDTNEIGAFITGNSMRLQCRTVAGNLLARAGGGGTIDGAVAASTGLAVVQRSGSDSANSYKNGIAIAVNTAVWSTLPNISNIAVCSCAGLGFPSAKNLAFAFVLSPRATIPATVYTIIQDFQTALGRQV